MLEILSDTTLTNPNGSLVKIVFFIFFSAYQIKLKRNKNLRKMRKKFKWVNRMVLCSNNKISPSKILKEKQTYYWVKFCCTKFKKRNLGY